MAAPKQKTLDGFFKAKPTAEAASQDSAAEKAKAGSCEQPVKVTIGLGNKKHDCEGRVITVEYKDFYIAFVYVPNAGEGLKRIEAGRVSKANATQARKNLRSIICALSEAKLVSAMRPRHSFRSLPLVQA